MKIVHAISAVLLFILIFIGALFVLSKVFPGGDSWELWLVELQDHKVKVIASCIAVLFLAVIFALSAIHMPERVQYLSYEIEGGGSVSISLKAMEDFIMRLGDEFAQVVRLRPEVKAAGGAVDVHLDVAVKAGSQIPELCRMLQERTRECIKENVGIADVRDVRVRVQEIVPQQLARETANPDVKSV